jgi:hypothetical protein
MGYAQMIFRRLLQNETRMARGAVSALRAMRVFL